MTDPRWSLYIDLEGFSSLYPKEDQILFSLSKLMEAIHKIGSEFFSDSPNRFFAHQSGDGFIIVGEFGANLFNEPVSLAIALMQIIASSGRYCRAVVSAGNFADITGCYSGEILECIRQDKSVIKTLYPVMGTALINAIKLDKSLDKKGPLLSVDLGRVSNACPTDLLGKTVSEDTFVVNWINSKTELSNKYTSGFQLLPPCKIKAQLKKYIEEHELSKWKEPVQSYLFTY